jgi:predicted Zn-dependent protease
VEAQLKRAEEALEAGRDDEALVLLWNALEPARLADDRDAYETIRRLARRIRHRDVEQLLAEVERLAGPPTDDLERRPQPSLARRVAPFLPFVVVLAVALVSLASGLASGREKPDHGDVEPGPRQVAGLPVTAPGVYLVALGRFESGDLDELAAYHAGKLRIPVGTLPRVPLDARTLDEEREQLIAEELLELLWQHYPVAPGRRVVVIGMTDFDMYSRERPESPSFFSRRAAEGYGVVSAAHLHPGLISKALGRDSLDTRLRKLVMRNIGVLYFREPLVSDPESVLFQDLSSVDDIDAMEEDF